MGIVKKWKRGGCGVGWDGDFHTVEILQGRSLVVKYWEVPRRLPKASEHEHGSRA